MRDALERIYHAGVEACRPERVLPPHLPAPPAGRTNLLAIGKAAAAMARIAEAAFPGRLTGLAVVPHDVTGSLDRVELVHAGHPVPDQGSVEAARRLLALANEAGEEDLVLVLLSGGASSLTCLPGHGLDLAGKRRVTEALLRSGASIGEINTVRRHLSRIKGGRLALAAAPARLLTLAISDVAGDRPVDIGSGPTAADPTTVAEAQAVLARYGIAGPTAGWSETPNSLSSDYRIIARPADAVTAAAEEAARLDYRPVVLGECHGEARTLGRDHAELALKAAKGTALISGGELVVQVTGGGTGGRNREYALAAALRIAGRGDIIGLAADTDGIDGQGPAAGAFFDGLTLSRSAMNGGAALAANDSGGFFDALGDAFVTGPTGTNVNDLRIILIAP